MSVWKRPNLLEWVSALLLFLMLREWLIPLQELTDTGILWPFLVIAASILIIDQLVPYRWLTLPVKLLVILLLLHTTLFDYPLFGTEWLKELAAQVLRDIPLAFHQDWGAMSPVSRNALFNLLLTVLLSMITYLVLEQRQGLWFVVLTELYLAVLDTFLPYEGDGGIIRTLIYGFLLLAVSHMTTMTKQATLAGNRSWIAIRTLIAPILIIAVSVGIAYSAPKKDASWPDPIAYFTGQNQGAPVGAMKKVGYDNNDERLGGPFMQDDTLVFRGITNEESYWRGDAKDLYTGVGWEKGIREYESILEPEKYEWKDELFKGFETKKVNASLEFKGPQQFATIFYPGQLNKVSNYRPPNATVVYDKMNQQLEVRAGKIKLLQTTDNGNQPVTGPNTLLLKLNQYQIEAEAPIVSEKAVTEAGTQYPKEIKDRYLQLPANLPPRVKELAESVTKNAKTPYEKVRAIENYLRSSGKYKYETKDVPVPQEGQDFVDHFLFDSYRGYCDHFSTAMAVMLRSIDIPTRWVKGFAPGERVGQDDQGNQIMEVRNKDAHSWVEVYFPNHGWVPFEATSTFMSPVRFKYDLQTSQPQVPIPLPDLGNAATPDRGDGRLDDLEEGDSASGRSFSIPWQVNAGIVALLAVGGFAAWKRRQDLNVWWLRRQMKNERSTQYNVRYNLLIRMMESVYTRRQKGETLREYVGRISIPGDKRQDLRYLTELYERVIYGYKDMEQKARTVAEQLIERLMR
ncbi:MAG: hypothetical protein K0R47_5050 [Brevibacillus sp.]|nr:hypothetical protein [Brevibacillus sp.]